MKKTILILTVIFILLLLFSYLFFKKSETAGRSAKYEVPTPRENRIKSQNGLYVVSTDPPNNFKDASIYTGMLIQFNKQVKAGEVTIDVVPKIEFKATVSDSYVLVEPAAPLEPDRKYRYTVIYPSGAKNTFSFTTLKPGEKPVEQDSDQAQNDTVSYELQNEPDLYLANNTPFENASFAISSEYTTAPSGHFVFYITLKESDKEKSKQAAFDWLTSLGFSGNQIQNLDIQLK